jgi:hypothetical protein
MPNSIDELLQELTFTVPPTPANIKEAYDLGVANTIRQLRDKMIYYPIGAAVVPALTLEDLERILGELNE